MVLYKGNLFDRRLRVELQKFPGKELDFIPENEEKEFIAWEYPMHIKVEIVKSLSLTKHQAKITMWNLSKRSRKYFQNPNGIVRILAGYGKTAKLIFSGRVLAVEPEPDMPDVKYEILCGGVIGYKLAETKGGQPVYTNLNMTPLAISRKAGVTWGEILQQVATSGGLGIVIHEKLKNRVHDSEYVFNGLVGEFWDSLRILFADEFNFLAAYNQIIITAIDDETDGTGTGSQRYVLLNRNSGLISAQDCTKQVSSEISSLLAEKNWTRRTVKCQSLFISELDVNSGVVIESKSLSDTEEIERVYGVIDDCEWILSNHEQDFCMNFTVVQQKEK
jgi:hypothetical protein